MRVEHIGNATLYLADCADVLPTLEGHAALVCDPPYGIGESSNSILGRQRGPDSNALADQRDYGAFSWDDEPARAADIRAARYLCRHQIIFGGNYFHLPPTTCWLVWDKLNTGDFADCELAWTNLPGAVRRVYWRWNGMIRKGHEARVHPTQKPLGVMVWCLNHLPATASSVLDPWMGSGTTGVAAVRLGRQFTGIERDERYFDIACERIQNAYAQTDMFIDGASA